jgi:hypothetical protein
MNKVTTNHDTFADAKQELFEKIKAHIIGVQSLQTQQAETPESRVDEIAQQAGEITRQF